MTGGPMVSGPMMVPWVVRRTPTAGHGEERVPESLDLVYRIKLVVDVES